MTTLRYSKSATYNGLPVANGNAAAGLILLYHRVGLSPTDPQLLSVSPPHFAEHLEVLRACGRPMRLNELVDATIDGSVPDRAVALTFDDGYADNLLNARPLLVRHDTPATVFVATRDGGYEREFWWDELDRLLLSRGRLPETLRLTVAGTVLERRLGAAGGDGSNDQQRHDGWTIIDEDTPTPRHKAYREMCALLRPLPDVERQRVVEALRAWAGAEAVARPSHRRMGDDEVARIADGGLIEVGGHTVSHPVLSALSTREQRAEVCACKARLEQILSRPVDSFAYPFGTRADYTAKTVTIVRNAGFLRACSNFPGRVTPGTDPFQLPRMIVRDWDGETFARRLAEAQGHD